MWLTARLLPCGAASRLGGTLLRTLGPLSRKHRQVLGNLRRALPEAGPAELSAVARQVWANLGAVLFEYPHLQQIVAQRTVVTMPAEVRALFDAAAPMLILTAHLGNWEVLGTWLGGQPPGVVGVYSPNANAPLDSMIQGYRSRSGTEFVAKQDALRQLTHDYLNGRSVGLLPDVRVDSAPSLPLFGVPAPTTISPIRMAARLGYPVVAARVKRLGPARFEIEFAAAIAATAPATGKRPALDLMTRFNALLQTWIGERPGEWMCTKRRWPKDAPPC